MSPDVPPKVSRRKRIGVASVCLVILLFGAWFVIEHWVLRIDQYRPGVIEAFEKATGLSADIGKLDLVLLPTPHLNADEVSLGEGDFKAESRRVTVHFQPLQLLRKQLVVDSVRVVALEVLISGESAVFFERMESIQERVKAYSEGDSTFTIEIASIRADSARLYRDVGDGEVATLDLNLTDAPGDVFLLTAEGSLPLLGEEASLLCEFAITRTDGAFDFAEGQAMIQDIDTSVAQIDGLPPGFVSVAIDLYAESADEVQFSFTGEIESSEHPALTGPIFAQGLWSDGAVVMDELTWDADGVTINATAGIADSGELRVDSLSVDLTREGVDAFAPMLNSDRAHLVAQENAVVHGTDISLTWKREEALALRGGSLVFSGVELALNDGEHVTNGLVGRFAFDNDIIHVEELSGEAFTLNGTIGRGMIADSLRLDLNGQAHLKQAHVDAFIERKEITEADVTVVVDRLAGTFVAGQGMPDDLIVIGAIRDGRIVVKHKDYDDTITSITARFDSDAQGIETSLKILSTRLGPIHVEGEYAYATHEWRGTTNLDMVDLVAGLSRRDPEALFYTPMLALYSPSALETVIELPYRERKGLKVNMLREGDAALHGEAQFDSDPDGGLKLSRLNIEAEFTLEEFENKLFDDAEVSGKTRLRLEHDASTKRFATTFDLTEAKVKTRIGLVKQKGDLLRFITSAGAGTEWQYDQLQIDLLEESATLGIGPESGTHIGIDIDLALLSRLLPEGNSARGRVSGEVRLEPLNVAFILEEVAFSSADGASIDSMFGGVRYNDGTFSLDDMRLIGANSEFTVDGSWSESRWEGEARGASLDLDLILQNIDAVRSFEGTGEIEEPPGHSIWEESLSGTMSFAFDQVHLRRGRIDDVRADIHAEGKRIEVRNIHAKPYSGSITGSMDIVPAENAPALVKAQLELESIDTKCLDDLLFEVPRKAHGTLSGSLDVTVPLGDTREMLAGLNGTLVCSGVDGSWGKLGFTTKLLATLKTVEIINLQAPSLRDEGLVYKSFSGEATFEDGLMTLSEVFLDGGAYAMSARGGIDFSAEECDIRVYTRVMESVSRMVKWVPLVGQIVEAGTSQVGVAVQMSGSPYDIEAEVVPGGGIAGTAVGAVAKGVKLFKNTIKKITPGAGENEPAEEVE